LVIEKAFRKSGRPPVGHGSIRQRENPLHES
jgi:hypothetical protein